LVRNSQTTIRIATRGSALALWQANWVRLQLEQHKVAAELKIIETQGDRESAAFRNMLGQGFFTKAVQDVVLEGRADIAVHSLKDLPSAVTPGLTIAAIPEREDAREVLLINPNAFDSSFESLPVRLNAVVGTSAVRRQAQLAVLRPDLKRHELRGNVPTRVEKLRSGEYNAIVLAWAGLKRLSLDVHDLKVVILEPEVFVPAPGQGALALECRSDDARTLGLLATLDNTEARETVQTERGLMAQLEGGCQLALGASAKKLEDGLSLLAWYGGRFYTAIGSSADAIAQIHTEIIKDFPSARVERDAAFETVGKA
jgi:hydroxymethylbilane synthase